MTRLKILGTDVTAKPSRSVTLEQILEIEESSASPRGSSYHKTLSACPREFALAYELGLRPLQPHEALIIGILWHYCLQRYYEAIWEHQKATPYHLSDPAWLWGGADEGAKRAYAVCERVREAGEGYGKIAELVTRMLDAYLEEHHKRDRWRILSVEETLIYRNKPIDPTLVYSCRLDLLIHEIERDCTFNIEHKSAKMLTRDLVSNYQLDLQILGQSWLIKQCTDLSQLPPYYGTIVNIATKPDKGTPKVTRIEVNPSDEHLAAFIQNVSKYQAIRRAMQHLEWPQYLGHCAGATRGYSECQFYNLCHAFPLRTVQEWAADPEPPEGYYWRKPQFNPNTETVP